MRDNSLGVMYLDIKTNRAGQWTDACTDKLRVALLPGVRPAAARWAATAQ